MEWWDGDGRSSPWLDLQETKEDSSATPNHNSNKAETEAAAGLHDLAYLAALAPEDPSTGPTLPPRKRKLFSEFVHLPDGGFDRKLSPTSHKESTRASHSEQKKKQASSYQPNAISFAHLAPMTESVARKQWHDVMEQQRKAQKDLLDAHTEHQKSQLALDSAKLRSEQAQENVQKTCEAFYLTLIQEDLSWYEAYQLLQIYKQKHGTTAVPRAPKKELTQRDPTLSKLSKWVGINRRDYRKGILADYKIHALNAIGFDWDPCRTNWNAKYQLLVKFRQQNGHARVKYTSSKEEDGGLGMWVKRQQYQYKLFQEGKTSELTQERIQLLNDVGMVWKRRTESWMNRYRELQKFKSRYGHLEVTLSTDTSLVEWVRDQRTQWKKYQLDPSQSSLTAKQVTLLEQIGFEVDVRGSKWLTKFQELVEFRKSHGHTRIPTKYPFNQPLSNWWGTQRRQYALYRKGQKSQLTKDRVQLFLDSGFDMEQVGAAETRKTKPKLQKTWDEVYAELVHYQKDENIDPPPAGSTLGKWCQEQRDSLEATPCRLTREQVEKLNQIDFDWGDTVASILLPPKSEPKVKSWEERLGEVLAFRLQFKSYKVPPDRVDLKLWIEQQQAEYQKFQEGKPCHLTKARIQQLEAVDFPFQSSCEEKVPRSMKKKSWEEWYLELLQYRLRHGNFAVSQNMEEYKELYEWCREQRSIYHEQEGKGNDSSASLSLVEQRLDKLRAIQFPWQEEPQPRPQDENTIMEKHTASNGTTSDNENEEEEAVSVGEPTPLHDSADAPPPTSDANKPFGAAAAAAALMGTGTLEESTATMEESNLRYGPFFPLDLNITAPTDLWPPSQGSPLPTPREAMLRLEDNASPLRVDKSLE
eukprot:scaffold497_cov97-Cylindrotheca_fusiformis.AAC.2